MKIIEVLEMKLIERINNPDFNVTEFSNIRMETLLCFLFL